MRLDGYVVVLTASVARCSPMCEQLAHAKHASFRRHASMHLHRMKTCSHCERDATQQCARTAQETSARNMRDLMISRTA